MQKLIEQKIGYEHYKEFLSLFKELLAEKLKSSLISLVLYGSVARGVATKQSDIDLLIIQKDASKIYYRRLESIIKAEKKLRRSKIFKELLDKGLIPHLSCLVLSREEAQQNRYIFLDMIENSFILYDQENFFQERLKVLRKRLEQLKARKFILEDGTWFWDLKPDLIAGESFEL